MDLSIIVPLFNEDESLPELHAWIKRVCDREGLTYEVIFVNDGSTDNSWQVIEQLAAANPEVHGICFRRNYGKSPALFCGFRAAKGDVTSAKGPRLLTALIGLLHLAIVEITAADTPRPLSPKARTKEALAVVVPFI